MLNYLIVLISLFSVKHDFHVSVTNTEFNPSNRSIEISMKLFSDDLETVLGPGSGNQKIALKTADSSIFQYVKENFWIKSGSKMLELGYVGKELEQDIVFIYLEATGVQKPTEIEVFNTVFFDQFQDQSNIVNFQVGDKLKSAFLTPAKKSEYLKFE